MNVIVDANEQRGSAIHIRFIRSYFFAARYTMASSNEKLPALVPFLIFSLLIVGTRYYHWESQNALAFNVGATPRYTFGLTIVNSVIN